MGPRSHGDPRPLEMGGIACGHPGVGTGIGEGEGSGLWELGQLHLPRIAPCRRSRELMFDLREDRPPRFGGRGIILGGLDVIRRYRFVFEGLLRTNLVKPLRGQFCRSTARRPSCTCESDIARTLRRPLLVHVPQERAAELKSPWLETSWKIADRRSEALASEPAPLARRAAASRPKLSCAFPGSSTTSLIAQIAAICGSARVDSRWEA